MYGVASETYKRGTYSEYLFEEEWQEYVRTKLHSVLAMHWYA